jgi:hypothetical protein
MRTRLLAGLVLMLTLSAAATAAQQAQELYQRGLVQEHAAGNLESAIALYTQAARAAGDDRALGARVLVRAAASQEKLGRQADAARIYAEVMRLYPEQRAEVTLAQERLTILRRHVPAGTSKGKLVGSTDVSSSTAPLFARYCNRCHNPVSRSGGFDLTVLNERNVGENTAAWEKVVRRLQARRDPPAGAPRPDDETYRVVIARLQQALDTAYAANGSSLAVDRANGTDLAVRLATLIWNAAPDAPLLDDARHGRLDEPAVLNRQVVRMLRDPKSASLVASFFTGWLSLDRLKRVRPDPSLYPAVDADLLQAMETETRLFIESQLREDRDAVELWTADYTFLNGRLAGHYGVPGVSGRDFRRVTWPDSSRAGILGQAGILTGLSMPSRTSPTMRGRFVLSRFFGVDPPDPPANVPALAEHPASAGTMRNRLLAHKANPSCANCHAMFDPLGLALENFDATGEWRSTDAGAAIETSGTFVDGTRFTGPAELRAGLLKYRDAYYTSLTQRLLAHALNREGKAGQVYDYEMAAVRKIVRDAAGSGYRWSAILTGIAASAPFQARHIVP